MWRYAIRRALWALPILVGVCLLTFVLFYAAVSPQQMARSHIGTKAPTDQQIGAWLKRHGYDKPLSTQFKKHLSELLLFRFGASDATGEPIWARLSEGIGPSALVAAMVFFSTLILGISAALLLAWLRGTAADPLGVLACILLMSVPYVVVILTGQFVFGKLLRWFPITGYQPGLGTLRFALMPAIVGTIGGVGSAIRFYRSVVLEELGQDYIRAARARGVPERRILAVHALRNASVPILTNAVLSLPFLLMGSLLLESFFGIPGIGTFTVDAIQNQDFAVVRAMVFLGAVLYVIGAVLADIACALADPRIRLE